MTPQEPQEQGIEPGESDERPALGEEIDFSRRGQQEMIEIPPGARVLKNLRDRRRVIE